MYLQQICDILNAANIECPTSTIYKNEKKIFTPDYPAISLLQFLPESKLKQITELTYRPGDTFINVTRKWGTLGLLQSEPYIVTDSAAERPTFSACTGQFISLCRNGYVCISSDIQGHHVLQDSCYSIEFILNTANVYKEYYMRSKLIGLLYFSVFIDIICKRSSMRTLLKENPKVCYDFIHKCTEKFKIKTVHSYKELARMIHYSNGCIRRHRNKYNLLYKCSTIAIFAFGYNSVQIEYQLKDAEKTLITVAVPDLSEGCLQNMNTVAFEDFCEDFYANIKRDTAVKMILVMAMKYAGIDLTWSDVKLDYQLQHLSGNNVSGVTNVKTLEDIKDISPDAF